MITSEMSFLFTDSEMTNLFNQVEELVGIYPSRDELRNAIHAFITNGVVGNYRYKSGYHSTIASVEYLARIYDHGEWRNSTWND